MSQVCEKAKDANAALQVASDSLMEWANELRMAGFSRAAKTTANMAKQLADTGTKIQKVGEDYADELEGGAL